MRKERIGFAFCGSFCNHPKVLALYEELAEEFALIPILSENAARYDTRFGLASGRPRVDRRLRLPRAAHEPPRRKAR